MWIRIITSATAMALAMANLGFSLDAFAASVGETAPALKFSEECNEAMLLPVWLFEDGRVDPREVMLSSRWQENVTSRNGSCEFRILKEKRIGKEWTSGHIWTKEEFLYGYFEARIQFASASGVDNAFWLMSSESPTSDPSDIRCEIDIVEGAYPDYATNALHLYSRTNRSATQKKVPRDKNYGEGFNIYAIDWTKDYIRWYWNNEIIREESNRLCNRPLAVRLSTAVVKDFMGPVNDKIDGTAMLVDYVRVYSERPVKVKAH